LFRRILLFAFAISCAIFVLPSLLAQTSRPTQTPLSKQASSSAGACSALEPCPEVASGMIQSALGASPLEENLRYLTDTIGGRVTGTPAAHRAALWAVEAFRHAGISDVHTEEFTVPVSWSEGHTQIEVLSPEPFPVRLVSIGWSPPTPESGITADIVDVGAGDDAGFAKAGLTVKGAIVLIHSNLLESWDDLMNEYKVGGGIVIRAANSGAVAILWMSTRPNLLLYRHNDSVQGELERMPQAVVAREDAERMARFIASGQRIRVHLDMPNRVGGPVESQNVMAEIRGRENPDEFVLLGAHLDSWELGTGALDNGCNVAMVIDAARVIHASGVVPRRSIRFALFTGEEQGMLGSWAYAKAHRAELDRMIAAIVFDSGIGAVTGFSLSRKDILPAVRDALQPVQSLGVKEFTLGSDIETDNFDFLLEGVPTLVASQEPANYMLNYHASSDTLDKVDITVLKRHVAIAAITAYVLADRQARIGPRQSRAEIEHLMKETGLDENMKAEEMWPLWEKGYRGRQP
jgi:carboxypeptidase Q